jgi:hypothetical protein
MTQRQKIEKYFFNLVYDIELSKPLEQTAKESESRGALGNSKYFEKLLNRYREKRANENN